MQINMVLKWIINTLLDFPYSVFKLKTWSFHQHILFIHDMGPIVRNPGFLVCEQQMRSLVCAFVVGFL